MKKLGSKYLIFLLVLACGLYFLFPTVRWYFKYKQADRDEAALSGIKLELQVKKDIADVKEKLVGKDQSAKKELLILNKAFIKELKEINRAIKDGNFDEIKVTDKQIDIKKEYTYDEMFKILTEIKVKEKFVNEFINENLEKAYIKKYNDKKKVKESIIKLGLDLQGGSYAVVSINFDDPDVKKKIDQFIEDTKNEQQKKENKSITEDERKELIKKYKSDMLDQAIIKIQNRINKYGLSETSVQKLQGVDQIKVDLPGVKDITELKQLIETVGVLDFKIVSEEGMTAFQRILDESRVQGIQIFDKKGDILPQFEELLNKEVPGVQVLTTSEKDKWGKVLEQQQYYVVSKYSVFNKPLVIQNAGLQKDNTGEYYVSFEFDDEFTKLWADVTGNNIGKRIAIILDNTVLYAPVVQEKIALGQSAVRLGNTPLQEMSNLALILKSGSLSVPLEISEEQTIGASMGMDTIQKGLWASLIGAILVLAFMLLYYNVGGIIADISLAVNILLLLGGMSLMGATLTMPGIAGIILTIGMAVDANVIIFERIKEEYRSGKTFKTAVHLGHDRAFWTILDSNLTTFLAGVGLSIFGTGPVKGFAVTLCMGILTTLFATLFVSRIFIESLFNFFNFKSLRVLSLFRGK